MHRPKISQGEVKINPNSLNNDLKRKLTQNMRKIVAKNEKASRLNQNKSTEKEIKSNGLQPFGNLFREKTENGQEVSLLKNIAPDRIQTITNEGGLRQKIETVLP